MKDLYICPACHKGHEGVCRDRSILLSVRIKAGQYVDGDRAPDYRTDRVDASEFLSEIKALEKKAENWDALRMVRAAVRKGLPISAEMLEKLKDQFRQ